MNLQCKPVPIQHLNVLICSSLGNRDPDLLCWWRHQTINRFDRLSLYKMKLELLDEHWQEHESFSDGESPSGTLAFACKAKRLVSQAWKLLDVFRAETIRVKPGKKTQCFYQLGYVIYRTKSLRAIDSGTKNNILVTWARLVRFAQIPACLLNTLKSTSRLHENQASKWPVNDVGGTPTCCLYDVA